MKVAILTQPLGHNYGGLLQAYALQHAILKLGADVVTVDRKKLSVKLTNSEQLKVWINDTIRLAKGKIKNRPSVHKVRYVLTNLHSFKANHIQISPEITKQEELIEYFKQNPVDLLIVGSDQVWRPKYSPCIENYFFDFYSKIESSPKRISYAASFGVDTWEFNEQDTRKCRSLISGFDAVSVREDSAIELCKSYLNVDAVKVVDPTLLLESSDYKALMPKSDVLGASGRVLNYILDPAKEKQDIAKKIASLLSKESLSIKPDDYVKVKPKHIDKCIYPGVELWLQSFFLCDYVVTDSFHGCVFSIIFNKPFIAVGNVSRGIARFNSLLSMFNLEKRLVDSELNIDKEILVSEIDWNQINIKRSELAKEASRFLQTYLSGDN